MLDNVKRVNPSCSQAVPEERKSMYGFKEGFIVCSALVFQEIADGKLYGVQLKVFAYMLTRCKRSNRFEETQANVARQLGLSAPEVSRAFRALREGGYVIRLVEGGMRFWYVDARRVFRGAASAHAKSLDRQRKQREKDRKSNVVAIA